MGFVKTDIYLSLIHICVLMSKLDSDTRGGAALSVLAVTGKPIKFVGMGEKLDEFEQFHPERMASRILGMGDVMTLIEKAEDAISQKDAEAMAKKLQENKFDMDDLLDQLRNIKKDVYKRQGVNVVI